MGATRVGSPSQRLRADAARNRARLLEAGHDVFQSAGDGADVSMEAVARRAGVGIGTLYRHFPTRLDLLEAVYRNDVDALRTTAEELSATGSEWEALAGWLHAFIGYAATKRAIFRELADAVGRDSALLTHSREVINTTAEDLLGRAQRAGVARPDVTAADVLRLVGGCTLMPNLEGHQAERVLRVVLDGIRVRA